MIHSFQEGKRYRFIPEFFSESNSVGALGIINCKRAIDVIRVVTVKTADNRANYKSDVVFNEITGGSWSWDRRDFEEVLDIITPQGIVVEIPDSINNILIYTEEKTMELKDIKKQNLKEAAKQVAEERANAEILEAKIQFRTAQDEIDRLDREIKQREEAKKPHLEVLAMFK